MTEERTPYEVGLPEQKAHEHHLHFVASNTYVIRYCEQCGRSWVIAEIRELVSNRTIPCWTEVLKEDQARDKLFEEGQQLAPKREGEHTHARTHD